jgi:hypothetical protein
MIRVVQVALLSVVIPGVPGIVGDQVVEDQEADQEVGILVHGVATQTMVRTRDGPMTAVGPVRAPFVPTIAATHEGVEAAAQET